MNPNQNQLEKAVGLLSEYSSGVICLPQNPTEDAVASACALYMGLTKLGKNVSIACSTPITSQAVGAEKISTELATAGDSLVMSFPYEDGAIDKVDYYIQNDRFNIVVTPRPGHEKIDEKSVKYSFTGGVIEYIVTIDATSMRTLGDLFEKHQDVLKGKPVINIDRHLTNTFFGAANFVNRNSSSNAELVMMILQSLSIELDREIATNLLNGIIASTTNYSAPHTNAQTFEASAFLMKHGAGKPMTPPAPNQQPAQAARYVSPQQPQSPARTAASLQQTAPTYQQQAPQPMAAAHQATVPSAPHNDIDDLFDNDGDDDDDWLKPSIFKPSQPDQPDNTPTGQGGNPNARG